MENNVKLTKNYRVESYVIHLTLFLLCQLQAEVVMAAAWAARSDWLDLLLELLKKNKYKYKNALAPIGSGCNLLWSWQNKSLLWTNLHWFCSSTNSALSIATLSLIQQLFKSVISTSNGFSLLLFSNSPLFFLVAASVMKGPHQCQVKPVRAGQVSLIREAEGGDLRWWAGERSRECRS